MDDNQNAPSARPSYWAVLPAEIRYDDRIPANAKILYAEISSLTGSEGYCWATDDYFARLYQITERSVRRLLAALEDQGYIRIEEERENHNILAARRIFAGLNPLAGVAKPLDKNVHRVDPLDKKVRPLDKKVQRHNILNNQEILSMPAHAQQALQKLPPEAARAVVDACGHNGELLRAWCDYIEMRAEKKSPVKTARTVELLRKKLERYSGGDPELAVAVLEQSTEASWTGLFELHRETRAAARGQSAAPQRGGDVEWL